MTTTQRHFQDDSEGGSISVCSRPSDANWEPRPTHLHHFHLQVFVEGRRHFHGVQDLIEQLLLIRVRFHGYKPLFRQKLL